MIFIVIALINVFSLFIVSTVKFRLQTFPPPPTIIIFRHNLSFQLNSYKITHVPPLPKKVAEGKEEGEERPNSCIRRLKKYRPSLKNQTSFDNCAPPTPPPSTCQKQISHWKISLLKILLQYSLWAVSEFYGMLQPLLYANGV